MVAGSLGNLEDVLDALNFRGFGAADAPKRKSVSKEGAVHVAG